MKRNKRFLLLIVAVFALGVMTSTGKAAPGTGNEVADGWYACTANMVGPQNGNTMVELGTCTDSNGNAANLGWVYLSSTGGDQMLATFLTAMSLGKSLSVNVSGTWNDANGYQYDQVVGLIMDNSK